MKNKLRLPSFLRAFFNVVYLLTTVITVIWVLMLGIGGLSAWRQGGAGYLPLPMKDLALSVRGQPIVARTTTSSDRDIGVNRIVTELRVNVFAQDPELASAARWSILPQFTAMLGAALFSMRLLRDLCARIEQGEVFSEETLRLVRNIGLLYVAFSLFELATRAWSMYLLGGYLARQATLTGIDGTFTANTGALPMVTAGLVEGLIILLLAEAFRQGLALKQEADLTV